MVPVSLVYAPQSVRSVQLRARDTAKAIWAECAIIRFIVLFILLIITLLNF